MIYKSVRPFPMWVAFPMLALVLAAGVFTQAFAGDAPSQADAGEPADADLDVPDFSELDASLAPFHAPVATSAAPAPAPDDSLERAETAVNELKTAVRTRNLGGALLALAILLIVGAKGLSRVGIATSERAQHVLVLCGGALAGVAYLIAADPSTVREAKATVLGCSGLIAIAIPKLPELFRKQA